MFTDSNCEIISLVKRRDRLGLLSIATLLIL